jgi:hypothetical protein
LERGSNDLAARRGLAWISGLFRDASLERHEEPAQVGV